MRRRLSAHVPDALIILGVVLVPVGVSLYNLAAALIVAGIEIIGVGLLLTIGGTHGSTR